jgi:hypothetical protein
MLKTEITQDDGNSVLDLQALELEEERRDGAAQLGGGSALSILIC